MFVDMSAVWTLQVDSGSKLQCPGCLNKRIAYVDTASKPTFSDGPERQYPHSYGPSERAFNESGQAST